ncbi:MAG: metal-sensitive transcriptional regulator, partial [Gammaproteobacteria bacterium]
SGDSVITRMRRIEGQLRGLQDMITQHASCEAVAQQVAATRRALDRAFYEILAYTKLRAIPSVKHAVPLFRHLSERHR